ncbi:MAG: glycosyltransferase family 2 protein [Bacteroidaceae bacterium]|nr:glycosyltransferase family 2 protein [Bacteroidaceae bacterium]
MLSILIPTKDYDCRILVEALSRQGELLAVPYEILLGEDGSSCEGVELNRPLSGLPGCRIIEYKENQGRARIRNRLAEEARYDNILFIDSDAVVEKNDFLATYLKALKKNDVVCGGLYHPVVIPSFDCTLRYKYEKRADKKRSAAIRSKSPYSNFSTFNFAIKRDLFLSIRFDENIKEYGYEDTLFGHQIKARGYIIEHIDNPLLHTGLESNRQYLEKIELSLGTLYAIREKIDTTPLLAAYRRLHSLGLVSFAAWWWRQAQQLLRKNLISEKPSLFLLNLYKLGYYCNYVINGCKK